MLDIQTKKQIRGLMQDPRWLALEDAFKIYLKENFLDTSIKRANEFETLWFAASQDGGKWHLNNFWSKLESEVMDLND